MSALVDIINSTRKCNIVTIEDPIEYLHKHKKCNVNQREVGVDTESFAIGLKSTATTPAVTSETSDVVATDTTAEDTEKTSFMPILIVLIVLALVGVAVWYFVEKRK